MLKAEKTQTDSKDAIILPLILVCVIVMGVLGLVVLQKLSVNNKFICSYLGGLWVKKDSDSVHRCYTYEEFYN